MCARVNMAHVRPNKRLRSDWRKRVAQGVKLPATEGASKETRKQAARDIKKGQSKTKKSAKRSRAALKALKGEDARPLRKKRSRGRLMQPRRAVQGFAIAFGEEGRAHTKKVVPQKVKIIYDDGHLLPRPVVDLLTD